MALNPGMVEIGNLRKLHETPRLDFADLGSISPLSLGTPANPFFIYEKEVNEKDTVEEIKNEVEEIEWRSCGWKKTAAIVFSEYICMAIMSFPWAYSVLGVIPGILLSILVSASVCYTSITLWRFCLKYPETQDICDLGQRLAGGRKWGWWLTAITFCLNNTFIQALHILMGAKFLNTVTNHALCTTWFMVISAIVCFLASLPRTFSTLSKIATISAISTAIMIILAICFAGIGWSKGLPYPADAAPEFNLWPKPGLTFAQGMTAFLNIAYTFIGQITLPTVIAEMKEPRDFPKVIYAVSISELCLTILAGTTILFFTGRDNISVPAFGNNPTFKLITICFALPTIIFLGVLFSILTAKLVYFQTFKGTVHRNKRTWQSTIGWVSMVGGTWIVAFLISELVPIFSDMLSLMSALFDSYLGYGFWALAWMVMRKMDYGENWWRWRSLGWYGLVSMVVNCAFLAIGLFFLVPGSYATITSIIEHRRSGSMVGLFSCADNAY